MPVDLEMLDELEGIGHVDRWLRRPAHQGECDGNGTDPAMVGEDAAVDVEAEPDRWLRFDRTGSRDGWRAWQRSPGGAADAALREQHRRAIEAGRVRPVPRPGPHRESLADQWYIFAADHRQLGRAREFLAGEASV
ncbi:hypothetical protein R1X32_11840 [Rhodococcus opacus]|uniref:hypothetical protein n=1 Tax=Rhodococcus opacus TaxID=37919 RepID=UPI0034D23EA5